MGVTRSNPAGISLLVRLAGSNVKRRTFDKFEKMCKVIIANTPVYSGELRHNYNMRYGYVPAPKEYVHGSDPSNPLPGAQFDVRFDPRQTQPLVFGVSTPYIMPIEYGSWSNKAPNGMIRAAIAEVFGVS